MESLFQWMIQGDSFNERAKGPEEIQSSAPFVVYIEKKDMTVNCGILFQ